jgi:hypothetical protein
MSDNKPNDQSKALVFDTPNQIGYVRFASLKAALKMEKVGLKTRGGALRPRLAKEFGLKPRDSFDTYIAHCETQMAVLKAKEHSK